MALVTMFPKVPTQADRDRLLALLRKREAAAEARQHRHRNLDQPRYDLQHSHKRKGPMFSHLPRDKQADARARFERYKLAHKAKLDSLTGHAKVRYLGSLAACAASHATRVEPFSSVEVRKHGNNIKRHSNCIRSYLGKQEEHPFTITGQPNPDGSHRSRLNNGGVYEQQVAAVHPNHGKPVEAEAGSTNMEGV